MDDLLSQVMNQFEEDIKNEEPKKEELKDEKIVEERFKISEKYIEQRREMIELSKIQQEDDSGFFKSKKKDKPKREERERSSSSSTSSSDSKYGYGRSGYGYGYSSSSSDKKDSSKNQQKATEYADDIFDNLRDKMEEEFNKPIPEDWDIFDIHEKANFKHKIAKETKQNGKLPFKVKLKLMALKGCIYAGHSTLETLYVLKNQ